MTHSSSALFFISIALPILYRKYLLCFATRIRFSETFEIFFMNFLNRFCQIEQTGFSYYWTACFLVSIFVMLAWEMGRYFWMSQYFILFSTSDFSNIFSSMVKTVNYLNSWPKNEVTRNDSKLRGTLLFERTILRFLLLTAFMNHSPTISLCFIKFLA